MPEHYLHLLINRVNVYSFHFHHVQSLLLGVHFVFFEPHSCISGLIGAPGSRLVRVMVAPARCCFCANDMHIYER